MPAAIATEPDDPAREVVAYWDRHIHGSQFLRNGRVAIGSAEFFEQIRPNMDCYRFPYLMERIEREAGKLQGSHLLEIGSGVGFEAIEFMRRGVRVTATDLTPSNVAVAKQHFALVGVQAEAVEVQDVFRLTYPDATFDAVYSNGVLSHTGSPHRALKEIYRVLKPGGRVIMSHFYRRPSLFHSLSRLGGTNVVTIGKSAPPVTDFFSEAELRSIFADFEAVEIEREHYRLIPSVRTGWQSAVYSYGLRPVYNLLPEALAKRWANKLSVAAVKPC
jgi:ubiquinone/menaquinone biosynthesis C-methylase UbiE